LQVADLIPVVEAEDWGGPLTLPLVGLHYNSKEIKPGHLFVAIKGFVTDGHLYVPEAIEKGAKAVILEREVPLPPQVAWIKVKDSRQALGRASAFFYNSPSHRLRLFGITGTNGKTTVAHLLEAILKAGGRAPALLGTIVNRWGEKIQPSKHTTMESLDLQRIFKELDEAQITQVIMEVSSHALTLKRLEGTEMDVGIFTNLSPEHLDFHRDMEDYFQSKLLLFKNLTHGVKKDPKYGVVNRDDPWGLRLLGCLKEMGVPFVTYGLSPQAEVRAERIFLGPQGTGFELIWPQGRAWVELKLIGEFNIYNALAAFALAWQEGIEPQVALEALSSFPGVPGRMERICQGQPFSVIVDYAHTPDGLEKVLKNVRHFTSNRVITVFGCGGDRDASKRPLMGRAAAQWSHLVVITSDNPRDEDPLKIIEDILPGVKGVPGSAYKVIPHRREAIAFALREARPGDTVLIAGKGHENYQIVKGKYLPFDDRAVAREELRSLGYGGEAPCS